MIKQCLFLRILEAGWRREWQPTPVFLPGEFRGQRSLAGYGSWGRKELDTTEWLTLHSGGRGDQEQGASSFGAWWGLFVVHRWPSSPECLHVTFGAWGDKERLPVSSSVYKGINSVMSTLPSWPNLTHYLPKAPPPNCYLGGEGLKKWISRGHKHPVHSMSKQNPYLNGDFLLTSVCLEADLASQFFAHPVVSSAFSLFPPFLPGFKILPYSSFLLSVRNSKTGNSYCLSADWTVFSRSQRAGPRDDLKLYSSQKSCVAL